MPHITQAMQRSVGDRVGNIMFSSLLGKRSITGDAGNVQNSFSSWDNCMKATYCKWPLIAIIIVVSLILLSIITCIVRCACCGMSCCCTCFSFLKCCDCCGGCCDGKKNKPHKHLDDPFAPPPPLPHQGYQPPAPMMGGALPTRPEAPQYAQFEVGKNGLFMEPKVAVNDDALPPMPSWEGASKKHVEEEKNGVELGHLDPTTGQSMPVMAAAAGQANNNPPSPNSPFASQGQGFGGNGYAGVPNTYSPQIGQNGFSGNGGYRGTPSPGPQNGQNGFNGVGGYRGGPSPGPGRGGRGAGYGSPQDINGQGRGYGTGSPRPGYENDQYAGAAVGGNDFGRPPPQRQNPNGPNTRPFPPQPSRQYSSDSTRPLNRQFSEQSYDQPYNNAPPRGPSRGESRGPSRGPGGPPPNRMQSPPVTDAAGFDFGTGTQQPYARPTPPPQQRPTPPPQQRSIPNQQMSYGSSQAGRQLPLRQASQDDYAPPIRQARRDNYNPPPRAYDTYDGSTAPPSYASRSPPPQEPAYPVYKAYTPPAINTSGSAPAPAVLTPGGGRAAQQGWDPVH
ncbi:hypothetical protein LOCC1_G005179 [Lachnellula occidentalis]|uniref:Fibroin-3 related protein n=1 Tax=Lachnellula occidentalis TaxID=215460 RepID=A0A8H8RU61_9HELO|nr:hypothetical protein LOCC1_G005179 [Lachnellula occidentalis]